MFADPAAARRGALKSRVVDDHGDAIRGEVYDEFHAVRTLAQGQFKGRQSVFRRFPCRAAVADVERWPDERLGTSTLLDTLDKGL